MIIQPNDMRWNDTFPAQTVRITGLVKTISSYRKLDSKSNNKA